MNNLRQTGRIGLCVLVSFMVLGLVLFQSPSSWAESDSGEEGVVVSDAVGDVPQASQESAAGYEKIEPSPSKQAKNEFSGGFKQVGSGFKSGTHATGRAFKKAGTTMGDGFKKAGTTMGKGFKTAGRSIRDFFVGKKSSDGVEERDLTPAYSEQAENEAAYETDEDLDAIGNDEVFEGGRLQPLPKKQEWVQGEAGEEASSYN